MKKESIQFLSKLLESVGPSGFEEEPAKVWKTEARTFTKDVSTDIHGNSEAVINPKGSPTIMLAGHCDEIGFMVAHIDSEGYIWITPIGGWDPQIPQGHHVKIRTKKGSLPGVIGKSPIHLLREDARNKVTQIKDLWVDIGAKNKKEAEKWVDIGDPLVLDTPIHELRNGLISSRALDDRSGAFVVLEAARLLHKSRKNFASKVHAVATVQEEIGLRGATTAANRIKPDIGIAVDVSFATDHPSMGEAIRTENKIELGKGPVISRGPNINEKLFSLLIQTANEENIPVQLTGEPRGTGTDANMMQLSSGGVATALIGIPNRYMHSPAETCSLSDMEHAAKLIAQTILRIESIEAFIPGT